MTNLITSNNVLIVYFIAVSTNTECLYESAQRHIHTSDLTPILKTSLQIPSNTDYLILRTL